MALKDIKIAGYNPRKISDFDFENLKRNIKEFGLVVPLLVNQDFTLIAGHQRYEALKQLGIASAQCIVVDLSKDREKLLNISLNRISGEWDYDLLDSLIKGIDKGDLSSSGFTESELREFSLNYDYSDLDSQLNGLAEEEVGQVKWTAVLPKEDYDKVSKIISKLKKDLGLSNYSSDEANGKLLLRLCDTYGKDIVGRA